MLIKKLGDTSLCLSNSILLCLLLTVACVSVQADAFQSTMPNKASSGLVNKNDNYQLVDIPVESIGSSYQNSIKLLNNRFRVDADIQEITIVFFREQGSTPIVLVRPDGSKLYIENDIQDESFDWFETDTYDMVSLKQPMPGPWQAVGDILPNSRVLVIAGIALEAQKIPELVFSGERIKQTARLTNIGSKVDISLFSDVVSLAIEFISTNNPQYPNFGLGSHQIAEFKDNGLELDENVNDGIMTGEFNLNLTQGEWRPVFTVKTPLFSREQINDNIVVHPNPITISHEEAPINDSLPVQETLNTQALGDETDTSEEFNTQEFHTVHIKADETYLDPKTVVISATVRYPNAKIENFAITDTQDINKQLKVASHDYGIYKVNMTVFATTVDGREIVLEVPQYTFVTIAPVVIEPEIVAEPMVTPAPLIIELPPEEKPDKSWIMTAVLINVFILLVGCMLIVFLVSKRNNPGHHLGHMCILGLRNMFNLCFSLLAKPRAVLLSVFKKKTVTENSEAG